MIDFYTPVIQREFLLVPVMPTPNGRLHLGHIAGPYLKMDVLARHLRRFGHRVCLISGSDVHESFVLLKAHQTGESPDHICAHFHDLISRDFKALDIAFDAFINPLDHEDNWAELYNQHNLDFMNRLIAQGATKTRREQFLYASAHDRYITGCWLLGSCPQCGSDAGSFFCETCGAHFRPECIREPHPRLEEGPLSRREVKCLYLRISNPQRLLSRLVEMGVPETFQQIARQYIADQGAEIRLTQPGHWGISWQVPGESVPQVIFTYTALFAYAVACGEIYGRLVGTGVNAFHPDSGVTTIASFGIDNGIPFLIGGLGGALEHGAIKPFDHFLINHFYHLEGAKFSTSRGHAIWAGDIAQSRSIDSDAVRGYLAKTNPESSPENFDVREFVTFINEYLGHHLNMRVQNAGACLGAQEPSGPSSRLLERLRQHLEAQEKSCDPRAFCLKDVMRQVETWVEEHTTFGDEGQAPYWWLKGLALLAYPIMPRFGVILWQALGHEGIPTVLGFARPGRPQQIPQAALFRHIETTELRSCLPPSLHEVVPSR